MLTVSLNVLDGELNLDTYTRDQLMAAREFCLLVKRTAKQAGFGEVSGRMIRETVGYKFDSMDVDAVLQAMSADGFLEAYSSKVEAWHNGLNKSASEATLKANAAKYAAAVALTKDVVSFKRLVNALRILCKRNQSWMESGNHLALPYNGHKAMLDLFGVNVTNNRRLHLTASH